MAVDAHVHLDLDAFAPDRDAVLARAAAAGVRGWVLCAADPARWDRVRDLAEAHGMPWTLGLHPWWEPRLDDAARDALLARLAATPTPHGVGETGLDHAVARTPEARVRQHETFRTHLALARERDVPVVVHCVRAYGKLLRAVRRDGLPAAGGMVHAWSGPAELVDDAVAVGLHLSFAAPVVRSRRLQQALARVPADRLLLETDAPDQALDAGGRGEPADLIRVAAEVAALRQVDRDALLARTAANARRLFPALPEGVA